jgi:hypothetical protein
VPINSLPFLYLYDTILWLLCRIALCAQLMWQRTLSPTVALYLRPSLIRGFLLYCVLAAPAALIAGSGCVGIGLYLPGSPPVGPLSFENR